MSHRLHVANLRAAAAARGDHSDYAISKRTGLTRSAISRLVNLQVEPTITTLVRLANSYDLNLDDLIQEVHEAPVLAA